MSKVTTDIDIDFADRDKALEGLVHIPAVRMGDEGIVVHQTGVYFQEIPSHPFTGFSTIPYQEAGDLGYFKIDLLNNSIYADVRDNDHLTELLNTEPEWSLLDDRDIVANFVHIGDHFGAVQKIRPRSIEDLAIVLALIRPGKRHLMVRDRETINREIWVRDDEDTYFFKKSHSIAYAASIVVQMNLEVERITRLLEEQSSDAPA